MTGPMARCCARRSRPSSATDTCALPPSPLPPHTCWVTLKKRMHIALDLVLLGDPSTAFSLEPSKITRAAASRGVEPSARRLQCAVLLRRQSQSPQCPLLPLPWRAPTPPTPTRSERGYVSQCSDLLQFLDHQKYFTKHACAREKWV